MRLSLTVEYDGTDYSGFQYQKNAPSVQRQLENAIQSLTGRAVRIKAAGRTDAGVHALGQVVAFDTDAPYAPDTVLRALNARLPDDVVVKSASVAPDGFDPRRHATGRVYRYTLLVSETRSPLLRRATHRLNRMPDVEAMRAAAKMMVGSHDFANFGGRLEDPAASSVRRVDRVDVKPDGGGIIQIEVEGSAFLPHQVRRMAGALVDVGQGRLTLEDVRMQVCRMEGAPVARALPARGLCLVSVKYEDRMSTTRLWKLGEQEQNDGSKLKAL